MPYLTPYTYVASTIQSDGSLPIEFSLDPFVVSFFTEEAIGAGPTINEDGTFQTYLLGEDVFSTGTDIGYVDAPLIGNGSGVVYSYERWIRVKFTTSLSVEFLNFRFWTFNGDAALPGWSINWGTSVAYHQPVNTASSIATNPVPMSDPGTANCGGASPLSGPGTNYSDWIVLQASADLSVVTDPGPALGYSSGNPIPILLYFALVQRVT